MPRVRCEQRAIFRTHALLARAFPHVTALDLRAACAQTTYEHETYNPSHDEAPAKHSRPATAYPDKLVIKSEMARLCSWRQDRVVLHVDFWNYLALTPAEISAMQRLYGLRERYLEAEGVQAVANKRLGQ